VLSYISTYCTKSCDTTQYSCAHVLSRDVMKSVVDGVCEGSDGSVDFDFVRINEESRQVCMLKNKGKFEIGYS